MVNKLQNVDIVRKVRVLLQLGLKVRKLSRGFTKKC